MARSNFSSPFDNRKSSIEPVDILLEKKTSDELALLICLIADVLIS